MNVLTFLRPMIRWINFLPIWGWFRINVWGNSLRAPTFDRLLCLWLHRANLMGKADHAFLQSHLRPGMMVVDIGANQGIYSLFFANRVGHTGQVHAFEPDDILHAALEKNRALNQAKNLVTHHTALGSTSGEAILHRSLLNSGDNRLADSRGGDDPRQRLRVRLARLDDLLSGQRVEFIKMDIQGWEMEAFRGMEGLLDDPRNTSLAIFFEFWPQGLRDAGSDPLETLIFLVNKGFVMMSVMDGLTAPISDLTTFLESCKASTYRNLFAQRLSTG